MHSLVKTECLRMFYLGKINWTGELLGLAQ